MNSLEHRMLDLLRKGRDDYHVTAVKAEFEAEGTRSDELLRLLELARRAGVAVVLKIGGCEAIRDLIEARQFGVDHIVAPMVETPYALSKYIEAKNRVFLPEERAGMNFLFNVETIAAYDNRAALIDLASRPDGVQGIVFGRVDFVGSRGLGRAAVTARETTDCVIEVARGCAAAGAQFVVGGAVTPSSIESLRQVRAVHLDRFETRKIIFAADALAANWIDEAMKLAIEFELLWLTNKQGYYQAMADEDAARIVMLRERLGRAA